VRSLLAGQLVVDLRLGPGETGQSEWVFVCLEGRTNWCPLEGGQVAAAASLVGRCVVWRSRLWGLSSWARAARGGDVGRGGKACRMEETAPLGDTVAGV